MLSFIRRISLVAALLAVAGCDRSDNTPTGPLPVGAQLNTGGAERFVQETFYDLTDSYTAIECDNGQASELIALEGKIFERFVFQFNPGGGVHVSIHTMPVGVRGVGVESGEEYRVQEQEHAAYNSSVMGGVGNYRQTVKIVGRTSGARYTLVGRGHYTVNANGELSAVRDTLVLECGEK
jgi:hypothetical protein